MIICSLLIYVGYLLNVPDWYFWLCGICLFVKIVSLSINMYKKGTESKI